MDLPEPTVADLRRACEMLGEDIETTDWLPLLLAQWAAEERRRVLGILGKTGNNIGSGWEVADYLKEETDAEI